MCANPPRHRVERRSNGFAPPPHALSNRDLSRGPGSDVGPRHARKVETAYAKYIGRIGALAVSLGVGVAVATTPGVAWASPDAESDPPASTSPDSEPDASPAPTARVEVPSPSTSASPSDGSPSADPSPANDGVPAMNVDSSGGAHTSTHGTSGVPSTSAATSEPAVEEPESGLTDEVPDESSAPDDTAAVETPVLVPDDPPSNAVDPQNDSPHPTEAHTAGSDSQHDTIVDELQETGGSDTASASTGSSARRMSAFAVDDEPADPVVGSQLTTFSVPLAPTAVPFDPIGAVLAIPGTVVNLASEFVSFVLTPFLGVGTGTPPQMPMLWAVLAWVRREITHTFFNRTPIAHPVQISQSLGGQVTGNLNAVDPNCDPLAFTVTHQGAFGTVVVAPNGTYVYTPTSTVPPAGLTDTFTVVIDDSVGVRLPGLFGVVQDAVHGFFQFIGLAGADRITKVVPVTVTGSVVNLPPVVVTSGVRGYTVGGAPITLDPAVTVVDLDSTTLSGATVSIGVGFGSTTDSLGYVQGSSPIAGSYNAATGVLTLSGTATVAQYQAALRSVTFATTADALASVRTVSVVVTDAAAASSAPGVVVLTVVAFPVNVPPVVVTVPVGPVYTAGSPAVALNPLVTVIDVDSPNLSGATVSIGTGFSSGSDTLGYVQGTSPIAGSYDPTTGVLTLSGTGTVAQYQAALRSVTFASTTGALATIKMVSIVVTDADAVSSLPGLVAVTVLALPISGVPPLVSTIPVGPVYTAGSPAVALNPLVTVVDVDSPNLSGATVSIGTGFSSGSDTLGYVQGGSPISGSYNSSTGVLTLSGSGTVAEYQAALRSVTFASTSGALAAIKMVSIVVTDAQAVESLPGLVAVTVLALPISGVPPLVTTIPVGPVYTAGSPAVALNPLVTVVDVDSPNLSGATVSIISGLAAGDVLTFTPPSGSAITGSYSGGTLTLTGTGTVAQYQEALQSVSFASGSAALATIKMVSIVVTDAQNVESLPGLVAVTVLALPISGVPPLVTTIPVGPVYTAGSPAVALNPLVTVVDVDSPNLSGATVSIISGLTAGDVLTFTPPSGSAITGSYSGGVLTLTGSGTVAEYQAALRSVTFASTTGALATIKMVSIVVTDAQNVESLPGLVAVTVWALPISGVPPLVTTIPVGPVYTAGSPAVALNPLVTVVDVDSPNLSGATVSIGNGFSSGTDTLGYVQGTSPIAGSYNSSTGVLTLSGTGTVAQYQEALQSVTFASGSAALATIKMVSIVVTDAQSVESLPGLVAVTVLALPISGVPPLVTTIPVGPVYTAGSAPVTLNPLVTVIDVDSPNLSGATVSMGTGFSSTTDTLGYVQGTSPIAGNYNPTTGVLTLTGTGTVAQYQAALRSVTFASTSGALATIKMVSIVVTDAQAVQSLPGLVAVTVLAAPLNVAPLVATSLANVSYTAGGTAAALDPAVTIIDLDSPNLSGATVSMGTGFSSTTDTLGYVEGTSPIAGNYNPTTGVLTLTGTGTVAQYQAALRSVTFSTTSTALASIKTVSIVVTDAQGAASLPGLVAVTVVALPLNVAPIVLSSLANAVPYTAGNPPAILDGAITILDDATSLSGATVTIGLGKATGDALAFTPPSGSSITGSYNSTTGVLTLTGSGTVEQYQQALRSVTFATTAATLVGVRTVSFVVTDQQGLTSISVPLLATVAANLPPVVTTSLAGALLYTDGSPAVVMDALITVTDLDSASLSGATVAITLGRNANDVLAFTPPANSSITGSYNGTTGVLTLTGAGTAAQYQQALRSVTFFSPFTLLGSLTRTVSIVVTDFQGTQSISLPLLLTVL